MEVKPFTLYLSPFSFQSLQKLFPEMKFHVELFISFASDKSGNYFVLEGLDANITDLLVFLKRSNSNIYEYKLIGNGIKIQSGMGGDLLIEIYDSKIQEQYLACILDEWHSNLTHRKQKININELRPGILYELSSLISAVHKAYDTADLIDYLYNEFQNDLIAGEFIREHIYYNI